MSVLKEIVGQKKLEVAAAKLRYSEKDLSSFEFFQRSCYRLGEALKDPTKTGIIAEFKRRSPSKGMLNSHSLVEEVTLGYAQAGASALSVLTDAPFFGGKASDLMQARRVNNIPILRKDFIIDEYQIAEAKAWGADIILLIAAILSPSQIQEFSDKAKHLGLSVLLEVHNELELERSLVGKLDAIGVNNRNLGTFEVDIQTSFDLVHKIPDSYLKISESAISDPDTIVKLRQVGFDGFLIGERFMRQDLPHQAFKAFVEAR